MRAYPLSFRNCVSYRRWNANYSGGSLSVYSSFRIRFGVPQLTEVNTPQPMDAFGSVCYKIGGDAERRKTMNRPPLVLADECNFRIFAGMLRRHGKYFAAMERI